MSAVLVTRGDVDITPVIESLPFHDVVVWDNSQRGDVQCYGRFAGIADAKHDLIYLQDDDLIIDAAALLDRYDGKGVLANVPPDEEWDFIGGGAIFPRDLPDFSRYLELYGFDEDFCRVCDVVFAYTHPYRRTWVGYERMLPWHDADNRMYKQPDHYLVRERARDRARELMEA